MAEFVHVGDLQSGPTLQPGADQRSVAWECKRDPWGLSSAACCLGCCAMLEAEPREAGAAPGASSCMSRDDF